MKRHYRVLIIIYTILLLYMMFFGFGRESEFGFIQDKPFQTINYFIEDEGIPTDLFAVNIIGNVIFFIPYGWLGFVHARFNNIILLTISFIITITLVEFLQFYTKRGTADIDDIILNTSGVLIGYLIITIARRINFADINQELELDYKES